MRADILEDEVQVLPADAGRLDELLLGHAAQLQAADVEVAEGDAAGVQLVLVAAELEPFPDMPLSPVLRVDGRPVGVARCSRGERSKGRCPLGTPLEGLLEEVVVMLTPHPLCSELRGAPALRCSAGAEVTFYSAVKVRRDWILRVSFRAGEGMTG